MISKEKTKEIKNKLNCLYMMKSNNHKEIIKLNKINDELYKQQEYLKKQLKHCYIDIDDILLKIDKLLSVKKQMNKKNIYDYVSYGVAKILREYGIPTYKGIPDNDWGLRLCHTVILSDFKMNINKSIVIEYKGEVIKKYEIIKRRDGLRRNEASIISFKEAK